MIEFCLPWPDRRLSPNARQHWAQLAQAKARYRYTCGMLVREQITARGCDLPDGPLAVELRFFRPNARTFDRDNLVARLKSGLDGMCDALGIDDKRIEKLTATVASTVVRPDGQVVVWIGAAT